MNIHLYSLHGLFRAGAAELGRDADNGGQISYVHDLARQLSAHPDVSGVTLVTRRIFDMRVDPAYAVDEERIDGKFRIRRVSFGGDEYLMKELLWPHLDTCVEALLRQARTTGDIPDVIHGHYADAGYVGARVAEALGVPFIHTGHSLGHPKLDRLVTDGMGREEAMRTYAFAPRFAAEELTLNKARFVITSSRQEVSTYATYAHSGTARFEVLPPGVDFSRFKPGYEPDASIQERHGSVLVETQLARFLRDPAKPLITVLCRADRKKNIDAVVRAYGESPDLRSMANLALYIGRRDDISDKLPGEREVYERLIRQVDRLDLYGRIAIPKHHDPAIEVPALYRAAARRRGVFVNVALTEPFGLTLLEAAASGLPVVATSDGGPSEIVPALENGLLADPNDLGAIQATLRKLLTDEHRWLTCSLSGVRKVRERYTWEHHVNRYLELVGAELSERATVAA